MTATSTPTGEGRRRNTFRDLYHERTNFQFIAHTRRWFALSLLMLLVSVGALAFRQLNLGIDFEGGTLWLVESERDDASVAEVRDVLRPLGLADSKVAILTGQGQTIRVQAEVLDDPIGDLADALADYAEISPNDVARDSAGAGATVLRLAASRDDPDEDDVAELVRGLGFEDPAITVDGPSVTVELDAVPASPTDEVSAALAEYGQADLDGVSVSTVGPTWGERVTQKAIQATVIFFLLLAVYLSFRFEFKMAIASIIAVLHDIVITAGVYALFQFEVTPATVTALLTILGFSLYDTVVVFDKVKENEASLVSLGRSTYADTVNRSLNEVLMRSLSTTLVAVLPVISLLVVGAGILGAVSLSEFAIALLVGLLIGSYSSLFVAAPLLSWWKEREPQFAALRERHDRRAGVPATTAPTPSVRDEPGPEAVSGSDERSIPKRPVRASGSAPRGRQQRRRKRR